MIAAGAYELTPVKRHFRRRCRADANSGLLAKAAIDVPLALAIAGLDS